MEGNAELYHGPETDYYPECGGNRVPVQKVSLQNIGYDISSSSLPRSSNSKLLPTSTLPYDYSVDGVGTVDYIYTHYNLNHCTCTWKSYPATPQLASAGVQLNDFSTSQRRFPADDYYSIMMTSSTNLNEYAPVAISSVPFSSSNPPDGRLGASFFHGMSTCGCPNLNERMVPTSTTDPNVVGAKCVPLVADDANHHRILKSFSPSNPSDVADLINPQAEAKDINGNYVSNIVLQGIPGSYSVYSRRIWTCNKTLGYILNLSTGACEFPQVYHSVGHSSVGPPAIPATVVSPRVTGMTDDERYDNTVNHKLAACLNGFGLRNDITTASGVKFDCQANDFIPYADFDELWASADSSGDGGALNALILANAQGQVITGFYQLDGRHCDEYSEWAASGSDIQPYRVNPERLGGIAFAGANPNAPPVPIGKKIPLPGTGRGNGANEFNLMQTNVMDSTNLIGGKTFPTATADLRRCPILVRAAAIYSCPNATSGSTPTYEVIDTSTGLPAKRQCAYASEVQIHLKIQQVFEIGGQPTLPTIDTVASGQAALSVDVQQIIAEKYGTRCPDPSMHRDPVNGNCVWGP